MRIPNTPIEFDYDLWTTEDGKCMVRVKRTGEVTEVDRDVMRVLRNEEKKLRRAKTGVPIAGCEDVDETATLLSLDFVSVPEGQAVRVSVAAEVALVALKTQKTFFEKVKGLKAQSRRSLVLHVYTGKLRYKCYSAS